MKKEKTEIQEFWETMTFVVIVMVLVYVYDAYIISEREKEIAWKYIKAHDEKVKKRELGIISNNPIIVYSCDDP